MTLADGTRLKAAIGIGAFADLCLVDAGQAVKVDPRARPEAAGLVGCGIGDAGLRALADALQANRIHRVDLWANPFSEALIAELKARFGDRVGWGG